VTKRVQDPNDPYLYLVPLTTKELADERARAVAFHAAHFDLIDEGFTCDDCKTAPVCSLVFDGYNTDGDCLLDK
jgi:hypothetical protein